MKLIYFVIIGNGLVRNSVKLLARPCYKLNLYIKIAYRLIRSNKIASSLSQK